MHALGGNHSWRVSSSASSPAEDASAEDAQKWDTWRHRSTGIRTRSMPHAGIRHTERRARSVCANGRGGNIPGGDSTHSAMKHADITPTSMPTKVVRYERPRFERARKSIVLQPHSSTPPQRGMVLCERIWIAKAAAVREEAAR